MKKIINGFFVFAGLLSLGLGVLGIVLPILPTTPFLLLSAACFAKGSKRFHVWFTGTKLYIKYIEQPMKQKRMTKKEKITTLTFITTLLTIGFIFSPVWYAKALIAVIAVGHFYYFLTKVKTIDGKTQPQDLGGEESC